MRKKNRDTSIVLIFREISKVVAHMWENIEPEIKEVNKSNCCFFSVHYYFSF